nr:glutamine synthetase PR-2-like [Populus alba]
MEKGIEQRLTGRQHETEDISTFNWGFANRKASICVGRDIEREGKGYYEDTRPASNMDLHVATSMIVETTILWKP